MDEDHFFARTISHENFLTCRMIDGQEVIYDDYEQTVADYVQILKGIGYTPVKHYSYLLDSNDISYGLVPEVYRSLISGMITFLCYIHGKGKSLGRSELSLAKNFVYKDKVLKFFQVKFRDATDKTQQNDFLLIHKVITEELLQGYEESLPYDMKDLLLAMNANYNMTKENYMSCHLAIFSHAARICFFRYLWDRFYVLNTTERWRYKTALINLQSMEDWTTHFKTNQKYSFVETCFYDSFDNKTLATDQEMDKVYKAASHHGSYEMNRSCFKFCRNLAVHLPQVCLEARVYVTDADIDAMIMHYFDITIIDFLEQLRSQHVLDCFLACAFRDW